MTDRTGTALWPTPPLPFHQQAGYPTHLNYQWQHQPSAMANGVYLPPVIAQVPGFQHGQLHLPPPPVAQPATTPAKPAGDQRDRDIFKDTTLDLQVKSKISGCASGWANSLVSLKGQERTDFMIVSFFQIAMKHGSNGKWNGVTSRILNEVGLDAMLAQKWPENNSSAHILARLKDHKWLASALARDGVLQSLHSSDKQGFSPLHVAVYNGKKKMVQAILAHDDEAGSLRLKKGELRLHTAVPGMSRQPWFNC